MKKILAFTLALAMVLSSTTMTFAASKEVEALANLKLLLNTTDAEVNADLNRAVGLAMVLKALGYTQEDANAKAEANTFVDMEKYGWAKGFTVLGEELKITNGTSVEPKMFSPNANLNERAFVAFMLRALGYDVDAAWAKAGELAKEANVAETVTENKLTKGDAAVIMYKALMAKVQGDEKGRTLAQKLVDEKKLDKDLAVANGLISGEPEKLTVTAMADNLIEVTVSFDGTVDKETAEKKENYKVKGYSVREAQVQEDNKTVVVTMEKALANKKEFDLTVSGVKNVAGVVMDKQTVKFTTNDVTAPKVEKVTVTGPKSFEITFSEPMKMETGKKPHIAVKQNKGSLQVKTSELKYRNNDRVLDVQLYNSFQEGKEYTVMVGDGKKNESYPQDYANYTAAYYEEVITYAKDTTAPEVKVVKADQEKVTVEFTKPVNGLKTKFFSHTFSSYHPLKLEDEKGNALSGAVTKAVLVFYDENDKDKSHAVPAGEVKLMVLGKSGSDKIEDNWKNQLADTELVMSISADREAPEVASVEVKGKNALEVVFTEEITTGTDWKKELTVQLLDKDGKVVEKNSTVKKFAPKADNKKVYDVEFKDSYVGKTMTFVLKGVKDKSLYKNVMADYSTEVTFGDKELVFSNDIKAEYKVNGNDAFVYVTFEEEMGDSALELSNYKFRIPNNTPANVKNQTPKGSAEFFEGNRKIVVFELTKGADSDVKFLTGKDEPTSVQGSVVTVHPLVANLEVVISNKVTDLAGNVNDSFEFVKTLSDINTAKFAVKEVRAIAHNKIEVEMDGDIAEFDFNAAHYVVTSTHENVSGDKTYTYIVDSVENKSSKVLEITLTGKAKLENAEVELTLPGDTGNPGTADTADNREVKLTLTGNETKNVFGLPVDTATPNEVKDKYAPAVASLKYTTVNPTAHDTHEEMYTTSTTSVEDLKGKPIILVEASKAQLGKPNATATVKIRMTEALNPDSLAITTFVVSNGWRVENANHNAGVITLTIKKDNGTQAELEELTVTLKGTLLDVNKNELKGNDDAMPTLHKFVD